MLGTPEIITGIFNTPTYNYVENSLKMPVNLLERNTQKSPNMVRNWKREFPDNAQTVFENPKKLEKEARRKEAALEKKNSQMLRTIGQLTLEFPA